MTENGEREGMTHGSEMTPGCCKRLLYMGRTLSQVTGAPRIWCFYAHAKLSSLIPSLWISELPGGPLEFVITVPPFGSACAVWRECNFSWPLFST